MKCDKCGYLLIEGDSFCRNCGKTIIERPVEEVTTSEVVTTNNSNTGKNKVATILCIISLFLYFLAPVLLVILDFYIAYVSKGVPVGVSFLSILAKVAAIVLMIVARVKYPDSIFAKVLMWIYIILIVTGVVLTLTLIFIILAVIFSVM